MDFLRSLLPGGTSRTSASSDYEDDGGVEPFSVEGAFYVSGINGATASAPRCIYPDALLTLSLRPKSRSKRSKGSKEDNSSDGDEYTENKYENDNDNDDDDGEQEPVYSLTVSQFIDDDDDDEQQRQSTSRRDYIFEVTRAMRLHSAELLGDETLRWIATTSHATSSPSPCYIFSFPGDTAISTFKNCRLAILRAIYVYEHGPAAARRATSADFEAMSSTPPSSSSTLSTSLTSRRQSKSSTNASPKTTPSRLDAENDARLLRARELEDERKAAAAAAARPLSRLSMPANSEMKLELDAEYFSYDVHAATFTLLESRAMVSLWLHQTRQLNDAYLQVTGPRGNLLTQLIDDSVNHSFHVSEYAFVWNFFGDNKAGPAYSLSLTFANESEFNEFRRKFTELHMQATLHIALETLKLSSTDVDFIMGQAEDSGPRLRGEERHGDRNSKSDSDADDDNNDSEGYDDSEESDYDSKDKSRRRASQPQDGSQNSHLRVGKDRVFAVRGSNIGVFGYNRDGKIVYNNGVFNLTYDRRAVRPAKVLLHDNDSKMLITDTKQSDKLYELDLNAERIVNEWTLRPEPDEQNTVALRDVTHSSKVRPSGAAVSGAPNSSSTFVGVSSSSIFNIDTRARNFVDWPAARTYKTAVDLRTATTTAGGAVAVGSDKGELRLYDRVGPIAKTTLRGASEPIVHLDTSADGRYVLATCVTHLLLFDVGLETGSSGKLSTAFVTRMPAAGRPNAIKLHLRPEHVAQLKQLHVRFTPATFNIGYSGESQIVTSTGNFVVTWNLADVLNRRKNTYVLKRFEEEIVADAFKFNDEREIILATANDVTSVSRSKLKSTAAAAAAAASSKNRRNSRRS